MMIGGGDRAAVLACYDETATAVYANLCRLCAADGRRASNLLVKTFAYLERIATTTGGVDVDTEWMVAAAHSVFAASVSDTTQSGMPPVAGLLPDQRVAVNLHLVEGRSIDDVALLLGVTSADAKAAADIGAARLTVDTYGQDPIDILRQCELWLDDTTRAEIRSAIETGRAVAVEIPRAVIPPAGIAAVTRDGFTGLVAPPTEFVRPKRSRWVVVGTTAAVVAILVGLAIWVSPDDTTPSATDRSTPTTAQAPTVVTTTDTTTHSTGDTTDTTTDTSATAVTVPEPGWILGRVPEGYLTGRADNPMGNEPRPNWFELWSSADAGPTSGKWLALVIGDEADQSPPQPPVANSTRVDIGRGQVAVYATAGGVQQVFTELPGHQQVIARAFGFSPADLVQLVADTTPGASNQPSYGPVARVLLNGMDLRSSRSTNGLDTGPLALLDVRTDAYYLTRDAVSQIWVTTGRQVPNDLLAALLLADAPSGPAAAFVPDRTLVIDGRSMVVGQEPASATWSFDVPLQFLRWHDGGRTIQVAGIAPLNVLIEAARTTRRATAAEWTTVLSSDPTVSGSGGFADTYTEIGTNKTTGGSEWSARLTSGENPRLDFDVQRPTDPSSTTSPPIQFFGAVPQFQPVPEPTITAYNSVDATVLIATVTVALEPDGPPPGLLLRVALTEPGRPPQISDMPLIPVRGSATYAVSFAFSELASYHASIQTIADGSVLTELDR